MSRTTDPFRKLSLYTNTENACRFQKRTLTLSSHLGVTGQKALIKGELLVLVPRLRGTGGKSDRQMGTLEVGSGLAPSPTLWHPVEMSWSLKK